MTAGDSWEKLSDAIDGPFERDIVDGLVNGFKALEPRIELAYKKAVLGAGEYPLRRLLTLRQELGQQLSGLQVSGTSQKKILKALAEGQKAADEWAKAGLYKKDPKKFGNLGIGLTPGMAQQNPEALIAAAQRTHALSNYALGAKGSQTIALINKISDTDLRGRIMGAVEFHLAQGDSWRNLEKTLKDSLEFAKNRAETVARTEMASAMVEGAKMRYQEEGIEYVQWNATGSSRTCGYCAPREGKVYELGKTVCPAHPNCRCALTPWDPDWQELGIASAEEDAKQRDEVLEELEAAGKKPINSASPFERALGLEEPPGVIWEPSAITKKPKKFSFGIDYKKIKKDMEDMQAKLANALSGNLPSSSDSPAEVISKIGSYKDVVKEMDDQMAKMEQDIALISIDPKPFDKKPTLPSTTSKLRKKKVTDVDFSYGDIIDDLGYSSREEYEKAVQSIDRWIGSSSSNIRGAEALQALEEGKDLSGYAKDMAEELKAAASISNLSNKDYIQGYKDVADSIEDFIDRAPIYKGEVHRGINFSSKQQADEFIARLDSGAKSVATESWTAYAPVAEGFATGENAPVSGKFAVILHVQNKRGAPVDVFNPMEESEVLIPKNSAYKVKRVSHGATLQGIGGTTMKVVNVFLKAL